MYQDPFVEIDMHGYAVDEARAYVKMALEEMDTGVYQLRIIHGYNKGTQIKDMLKKEFANHPKVLRIEPGYNEGITVFILREL